MQWIDVYVDLKDSTTVEEVAGKLERAARQLRALEEGCRLYALHDPQPLVRLAVGMPPFKEDA